MADNNFLCDLSPEHSCSSDGEDFNEFLTKSSSRFDQLEVPQLFPIEESIEIQAIIQQPQHINKQNISNIRAFNQKQSAQVNKENLKPTKSKPTQQKPIKKEVHVKQTSALVDLTKKNLRSYSQQKPKTQMNNLNISNIENVNCTHVSNQDYVEVDLCNLVNQIYSKKNQQLAQQRNPIRYSVDNQNEKLARAQPIRSGCILKQQNPPQNLKDQFEKYKEQKARSNSLRQPGKIVRQQIQSGEDLRQKYEKVFQYANLLAEELRVFQGGGKF